MRIFVGGSFGSATRDHDLCKKFIYALGREIVKRGHVLLNGCRSPLDATIAGAAEDWLIENELDPAAHILSYCLKDQKPVHEYGKIRYSALSDWEMTHAELRLPEQIERSHIAIFVAGSEGTFGARNWAYWARKPILGIPRFGGSGETIYYQELRRREEISSLAREEYEVLNELVASMSQYAKDVVDLAERLVTPRTVFPIMSFKREFRDVSASYREVCEELGFDAERTDESDSTDRILPRIENGIRQSAFVIADLTEPSPNVFYEIGFAKGMGKEVIATAKKGTQLPFDVSDVPIVWWELQEELKAGLRKRIAAIVKART
ncbi:MAG TPA: hypothetical protein VGJ66_06660 [Pyrinomonadaceae bacterium]|jgi:hypothetical protein